MNLTSWRSRSVTRLAIRSLNSLSSADPSANAATRAISSTTRARTAFADSSAIFAGCTSVNDTWIGCPPQAPTELDTERAPMSSLRVRLSMKSL
jgi:hypothetical protein